MTPLKIPIGMIKYLDYFSLNLFFLLNISLLPSLRMTTTPNAVDGHRDKAEMGASSADILSKTKQQRKEEGRQRALDIAMAKQKVSRNDVHVKNSRHGARNQHRHKHFARWILDKFPHIVEDCMDIQIDHLNISDSVPAEKTARMHILDVAGGKGELSARLSMCHSLHVVMIDPRPADIESVYMKSVVPKLPKVWQQAIRERLNKSDTFVKDELEKRFSQLVMPFSIPSSCTDTSTNQLKPCFQDERLDVTVRDASLIIGLHADGATEAIVDAALLYQKPFVVVPCCVFPNLFCERYITIPNEDSITESTDANLRYVPVRTHDQFCKYLLAKDSRFEMEILPFEGRNIAIWWDGK